MQAPSRSLHHVIIGTGEAGLACAMALREDGQENVVLIGAEEDAPYERPRCPNRLAAIIDRSRWI